MAEGKGPKNPELAQQELEALKKNPIDAKLDALLEKSGLNVGTEEEKTELRSSIVDGLSQHFENSGEIKLNAGELDKGVVYAKLMQVFAGTSFEGIKWNQMFGTMAFRSAAATAISAEFDKKFFQPIEKIEGFKDALKDVATTIKLTVDKDKGTIDVALTWNPELNKALNDLFATLGVDENGKKVEKVVKKDGKVSDPEKAALEGEAASALGAFEAIANAPDKLADQKNRIRPLVDKLMMDVTLMQSVASELGGAYYYSNLSSALANAVQKVGYFHLNNNPQYNYDLMALGPEQKSKIDVTAFRAQGYEQALRESIQERAMTGIDQSITAAGMDLEKVKMFDAKNKDPQMAIQYLNGQFQIVYSDSLKSAYDAAAERPEQEMQDRIDEIKSGPLGWFLVNVFGMKDKEFLMIAKGQHPLYFAFGAISDENDGASYEWARDDWLEAEAKAKLNPKLVPALAAAKAFAKKIAPFSPGGKGNPLLAATGKSASEFASSISAVNEKFSSISDPKGVKLTSNYGAEGGIIEIKLKKGQEVRFPGKVEYMIGTEKKSDRIVKFQADTEKVLVFDKADLPKGTFLSKGVQIRHTGISAEAKQKIAAAAPKAAEEKPEEKQAPKESKPKTDDKKAA